MQPKITREKNIVDFIVAVAENRDIGIDFVRKLKPKVKAEEIRAYLQDMGYAAISLEECEKILRLVNKHGGKREEELH